MHEVRPVGVGNPTPNVRGWVGNSTSGVLEIPPRM